MKKLPVFIAIITLLVMNVVIAAYDLSDIQFNMSSHRSLSCSLLVDHSTLEFEYIS